MGLPRLEGKSLLIFAGKGGVGKTTCSAATALHYSRGGRKTLLVTVDPAKRLEDSLGLPIGHTEKLVQPNLYALMLDPEETIRDFLQTTQGGARVLEHPLFKYVSNYLPGLNELMAIGKLNEIRREADYDLIVIDTAPTGHALSFLSAPKAIRELMSEKSLLRWALRGYALWQRFSKASRGLGKIFGGGKRPKKEGDAPEDQEVPTAPDLDLEQVFKDIAEEAQRIQEMLTDEATSAINIVTIPEKLPIEETVELHERITGLGMHVGYVVVNKMQPDTLDGLEADFFRLKDDAKAKGGLRDALGSAGYPGKLVEAVLAATEFNDLRHQMNRLHVAELQARLPEVPRVALPLFKQDVAGIPALLEFEAAMFSAGHS